MCFRCAIISCIIIASVFALPVAATEITSTSFKILDPAVDDGGTRSASTSYILHGRVGETATSRSTSTSYVVVAGSAGFPAPAVTGGTTVTAGVVSSSGGAGGSISSVPTVVDAVISGRAYPGAAVTILRNDLVAREVTAGSDGVFSGRIFAIQAGRAHNFGVYGRDSSGRASARLTYTVNVPVGVVQFTLSDVFLPPTVSLARGEVRQGEEVTVRGVAFPKSAVTVEIVERALARTSADAQGQWEVKMETKTIEPGTYPVRVRAEIQGERSESSVPLTLTIAALPMPPVKAPEVPKVSEVIEAPKVPEVTKAPEAPKVPEATKIVPKPAVAPRISPPLQGGDQGVVLPTSPPLTPPQRGGEIERLAPLLKGGEVEDVSPPLQGGDQGVVQTIPRRVYEGTQELRQSIAENLSATVTTIREAVRAIPEPKDVVEPILSAVTRAASAVPRLVSPIVKPVAQVFTEALPRVIEPAVEVMQNAVEKVGKFFGRLFR